MSLLDQIDAVIDGLCGNCHHPIPDSSPSAYFCGPDCQRAWDSRQATNAAEVENQPDSTYPPLGPMRWRPDLVTAEDNDTGLELVATNYGPTISGSDDTHYTGRHNARLYRRTGQNVWHLRLDDGYRWVGCDVPDNHEQTLLEAWSKLERELGNPQRMEPVDGGTPYGLGIVRAVLVGSFGGTAVEIVPYRGRIGTLDGYHNPRRTGLRASMYWLDEPHRTPQEPAAIRSFLQRIAAETGLVIPGTCQPPADSDDDHEEPAEDPRQRALRLRRERNTGPAPAPLDPRRRHRR